MGHPHDICFYGTATVGTKGQIVIPAKARESMGVEPGDMLVVIGMKERNMLGICPVESVEAMLAEMTKRLESIRSAVDQTKQTKQTKGD